jgi:prepilin-type processing-associated H-X9-DG protein
VLTSSNLSYFINPNAPETYPQELLFGDDNLEIRGVRVKSGILAISNQPIAWSPDRHGFCGNVAFADGSAAALSNLQLARGFPTTNTVTLRLAIP